jgi:hypothetical protein
MLIYTHWIRLNWFIITIVTLCRISFPRTSAKPCPQGTSRSRFKKSIFENKYVSIFFKMVLFQNDHVSIITMMIIIIIIISQLLI